MIGLALKRAQKSTCRTQHGAVVVQGHRVVGIGHNSYKTTPSWGSGPLSTLHAEAAAIRDAVRRGINLHGATIFVARFGVANQMSRPCHDCQKRIKEYGISKVYYTDESGFVVSEWPL